jgi:hypothetical protein
VQFTWDAQTGGTREHQEHENTSEYAVEDIGSAYMRGLRMLAAIKSRGAASDRPDPRPILLGWYLLNPAE